MTGKAFAEAFVAFIGSLPSSQASGLKMSKLATIAARPDQSKHLETATTKLLGLELDFVQLRSEEYGEGSRIPEKIVSVKFYLSFRPDLPDHRNLARR